MAKRMRGGLYQFLQSQLASPHEQTVAPAATHTALIRQLRVPTTRESGGIQTPSSRLAQSRRVESARAHTLVRFRAPSGVRGWFVRGCFGGKTYSILFYNVESALAARPPFRRSAPSNQEPSCARLAFVRIRVAPSLRQFRAHTFVRFRAPSGVRGWFVRGCFGGTIDSIRFYSPAPL